MEMLKALAPFAALGQTLVWVLLIVGLVMWLNGPIKKILEVIYTRVDAGNAIKVGWFELAELKTLSREQQRIKAQEEIAILGEQRDTLQCSETKGKSIASIYFESEDLALRAVQTEYGVPLVRQVEGVRGAQFDAAFVKDGCLHVVEVKSFNKSFGLERLRSSIGRIADATRQMGGPKAHLIVAIVYTGTENQSEVKTKIGEVLMNLSLEVDIRVYSLENLRKEFGSRDV